MCQENGFVWWRTIVTVYGARPTFTYPRVQGTGIKKWYRPGVGVLFVVVQRYGSWKNKFTNYQYIRKFQEQNIMKAVMSLKL